MTARRHPLRASPGAVTADMVERIQAEELSGRPRPGKLRAADVVEVRS